MRPLNEILASKRVLIGRKGLDGFSGEIHLYGWSGSIICTNGGGWEHVSVSPFRKNYTPSWDDMTKVKEIFFRDDEAVIQIHPPKSEYVNNVSNCLHLWRCTYKEMTLPPSCFVGIKEGQTAEELREEIKKAYELAGEKYEK